MGTIEPIDAIFRAAHRKWVLAAPFGAACHSDLVEEYTVLAAMRAPTKYAMGTIRF